MHVHIDLGKILSLGCAHQTVCIVATGEKTASAISPTAATTLNRIDNKPPGKVPEPERTRQKCHCKT